MINTQHNIFINSMFEKSCTHKKNKKFYFNNTLKYVPTDFEIIFFRYQYILNNNYQQPIVFRL